MSFESPQNSFKVRDAASIHPARLYIIEDPTKVLSGPRSTFSRTDADQQADLDRNTNKAAFAKLYGDNFGNKGRPEAAAPFEEHRAQDAAIQNDLRKHGRQPGAVLTQLMRDNAVVGIGVTHQEKDPQLLNAPEILRRLKEGGATHLAIDAPRSSQIMLSEFNRTGNLDVSKLPVWMRNEAYQNTLKSARDLGLQVVAGNSEADTGMRRKGETMASTIKNILDQPNQDPTKPNKVAFLAGGPHLHDYSSMRASGTKAMPTAAEILRQGDVKIATVNHKTGGTETPLTREAMNLRLPEIVSTRVARHVGNFKGDADGIQAKAKGDHIILYPTRSSLIERQ